MSMNEEQIYSGSCACGNVIFNVNGELSGVTYCHCTQCQKASGHYVASTSAKIADFELLSDSSLRWYQSSKYAKRGFCSNCGSNLFWKLSVEDEIGIWPGSLDNSPKLKSIEHIFCSSIPSHYEIKDDLPKHEFFPGYENESDIYGIKNEE